MSEIFVDITPNVKRLWAQAHLQELGYLDSTGYHFDGDADCDGVRTAYYWSQGEHLDKGYPQMRELFHEIDPDFDTPPWRQSNSVEDHAF